MFFDFSFSKTDKITFFLMNHISKRAKISLTNIINRGFTNEKNVGITEFVGKQKPFIGWLKDRFEDFIVHEIDKQGNVVRLTNVDKPEDVRSEPDESDKIEEPKVEINQLNLGHSFMDEIESFINSNYQSDKSPLIPIDQLSKEERKLLHQFIKQNFSGLESTTQTVSERKFLKVMQANDKNSRDSRVKFKWPKNKPKYVHFVLFKTNMETVEIVNELSRLLGCTTKNLSFAGTKDKRAITTQTFSIFQTSPLKVWNAVRRFNQIPRFNNKTVGVGHFRFEPEQLRLGDHSGNMFDIIFRNVLLIKNLTDETDSTSINFNELKAEAEESLKTVKNIGFINYYGMQRFGSKQCDSHKLGISILKKDFKQLVHGILCEKKSEISPNLFNKRQAALNEAINCWRQTGDAALAYKKLSYKYTLEGSLLRALSKVHSNDYHGALCLGLVRSSRLLYLHAYQSYLWNRTASFRIKEYGLEVVEGDLVFVGPDFFDPSTVENEESVEELVDDDNGKEEKTTSPSTIKANIPNEQIIVVNQQNINQFNVYDVVLPIIGAISKLPQNRTKDYIAQILEEDNVSIEDFASLRKQWCVNGSYRKLLSKPKNLDWQWISYEDENKPLLENDLQLIEKIETEPKQIKVDQDHQTLIEKTDSKIALKLSFILPTSSYATIMVREITKLSSSSLENKPWNYYHKNEE